MIIRILILTLLTFRLGAQLSFSGRETDLGKIAEAYEIKGDVIIKNNGPKKTFLMRADADKGVKVFASKKTLQPNDTALLVISFIPENAGKFKKKISLVSSDSDKPYELELSGDLGKLKADDKLACFYFGSRSNSHVKVKDEPIAVKEPDKPRDNSNKMPDHSSEPGVTYTPETVPVKDPEKERVKENPGELSVISYKPNNILFLVDVSSSMKDSVKLPVMQQALYKLIDAVRDIDKITFVTYADSTRIIKEAVSGADKKQLREIVASIKARGKTKGNKAILKSQEIAQRNFINEGNNQIILATDGEFKFYPADRQKWNENQAGKQIVLTTVAFGNDKDAVKNLKEIAQLGKGSFIHIKNRNGSQEKLLDEVKTRSKR